MSLFDKIMIGGDEESPLPDTRFKAFLRYGREYFGRLVLFGVITSLFLAPSIAWLFVMNYGRLSAISAIDATAADYATQINAIRLSYALTTYAVMIPLTALFFIGLSGLFSAVKRISQGDACKISHYFKGVRENGLRFVLMGAVFGVSLFFVSYNVAYLSTVTVNAGTAALFAVTVLQFVFCGIFACWFMTGVTLYEVGLMQAIKNSFRLTFAKLFKNLIMYAAVAAPVIATVAVPSPFNLLVMTAGAFLYFGFAALGVFCYANYVYDGTLNKTLGKDFVGRGLNKNTATADAESAGEGAV